MGGKGEGLTKKPQKAQKHTIIISNSLCSLWLVHLEVLRGEEGERSRSGSRLEGMQMCPSIAPINLFKLLPFTPTAINSKAQRREAHAGVLIGHMFEPQRGSTNNFQYALGLIHCGTPLGFDICCPIQPSVRCATLGFGVELLCSSFQPQSHETASPQSRDKAAPTAEYHQFFDHDQD